jgi:tRNA pseudouridine13 synthase
MLRAAGDVDRAEVEALERAGVTLDAFTAFDKHSGHMIDGARRPLRVPVTDPIVEAGADEHGEYIRCAFELPRGAFATVVLREIMKPREGAIAGDEDEHE